MAKIAVVGCGAMVWDRRKSQHRYWAPIALPSASSEVSALRYGHRAEADFQAWRDAQDWIARKYAMWEAGEKLPSQAPSSLMRCPCGEVFDSHRLDNTVIHVPHIAQERAHRFS